MTKDYRIVFFENQSKWAKWLAKNHNKVEGVFLRINKKDTETKSVSYQEALDEALCYGWIDGQAKRYDEQSYLLKFTPRRARSVWSKRNTDHVERLIKLNKMKPSGLAQVEAAKKDGRWQTAYGPTSGNKVPESFLKELKKNKSAYAFFKTLSKSHISAIAWYLENAKRQETRDRRAERLVTMLSKGEKLY